jgi:hydroxymethylbilane synthase
VIRIATRASQLALWQAHHVADLIRNSSSDCDVEVVHISTEGDRDRNRSLAAMGGVGVFTREVQAAVLDGRADLAVHSLKDLPTETAAGLTLAAVPDRYPVHDALILPVGAETASGEELVRSLPTGARIGTGSPRRQAQLLHFRDDLQMLDIRGNVETRLKKLDDGEYDAIVLAEAGLRRLEFADRISGLLQPPLMLHAVGQGALGIECRADDEFTRNCLAAMSNADVLAAVTAERSLLRALQAGCHAPVGVSSRVSDDAVFLEGVVLSPDGTERFGGEIERPRDEAESAGALLAQVLIAQGAGRFVD